MAGKKENIKALFSNTRTRVIILFTAALLIIAVTIGFIKFSASIGSNIEGNARLGNAPGAIQSIPGGVNPTAQYAALQETQNLEQAQQAQKSGSSAIPTIIRSQAFGDGVESVGPQGGAGSVGFETLAREDTGGQQQSLWIQTVKDANCSKVSLDKVIAQGASLKDLKNACTCLQLKTDGYGFSDLNKICSCKELKSAGYNARDLKDSGYTASRLRICGFDACELHGAGFNAIQMKNGGFSDGELKGAGFSEGDIARAGGLPDGVTEDTVRKAGCSVDSLTRLHDSGVSAAAIRRISGCAANDLKAAGFNAEDLKNAGFSAADLLKAGFSPEELKAVDYTPRDLLNAGLSSDKLAALGFSSDQIKAAEMELPPGVSPDDIKAAGCSVGALKREQAAGISAAVIHQYAGCDIKALKTAGFSNSQLENAGFSPQQISAAGFTSQSGAEKTNKAQLSQDDSSGGVDDNAIRAASCDPKKLHVLFLQGASAQRIHDLNGCSAAALKAAGYDATKLANAGFSTSQLLAAGFTPNQLKDAGLDNDDAIRAAGCDPQQLHALFLKGVSAKRIHDLNGCSAAVLKAAGYDAAKLLNAGFNPSDLISAGFKPDELKQAELANAQAIRSAGCDPQKLHALLLQGVTAKQIHDLNGCSPSALKAAGFDAAQLLNAGFNPAQLLAAGFTPEELKQAGLSNQADIRAAGCDPQKLHSLLLQGVSAKQIHDLNGCNANALKAAGFDAAQLLNAGFSPAELLAAGFTPELLKQAALNNENSIRASGCDPDKLHQLFLQGVTAKDIHDMNGCGADVLKAAGFDATSLANAGFTPAQLLAAGFTNDDLKPSNLVNNKTIQAAGCDPQKLHALLEQGVSAKRIHDLNGCSATALKGAGYDAAQLLNAGFSPQDLLAAGFTPDALKQAALTNQNAIHAAGCDPKQLHDLFMQGVTAKQIHDLNGCSADALRSAGYDAASLTDAGFTPAQLLAAGFSPDDLKDAGLTNDDSVRAAGCDPQKLHELLLKGVSAKRIHDLNGCGADLLKAAGYDAASFANAGYTPAELLAAGFTPSDLKQAGLNPVGVISSGRTANCSIESLKAAHTLGVSPTTIKQTLGCSAKALRDAGYTASELKNGGFTVAELKNAGFNSDSLKNAGFSAKELKAAGYSAQDLKNAGFDAKQLKDAGFSATDLKNAGYTAEQLKAASFDASALKNAGFTPEDLRKAGYSAKELKEAGFTAAQMKNAGYSAMSLQDAGFSPNDSGVASLDNFTQPSIPSSVSIPPLDGTSPGHNDAAESANTKQLQEILKRQQSQVAEQRYQQKIQQKTAAMLTAATQAIQGLKTTTQQTYISGSATSSKQDGLKGSSQTLSRTAYAEASIAGNNTPQQQALIKAGDVMFAVLDTSVNSDEPGPILATIVSGKLNGAKLIGSFTLPANADKMVISFNTMSVPGAAKTTSINAYAIDPNTARTALSSQANHHYLTRYGSLFAATFLEGFGNAFQSANTTITIGGGAGNTQNTTISNGVGRSIIENAVIGLATLGKSWGQIAQQQFNLPTTVDLFSGTGIGVLFTQDLKTL